MARHRRDNAFMAQGKKKPGSPAARYANCFFVHFRPPNTHTHSHSLTHSLTLTLTHRSLEPKIIESFACMLQTSCSLSLSLSIYIYIYIYCVHKCIHISVLMYVYVYMYMCVYTHTHTHTSPGHQSSRSHLQCHRSQSQRRRRSLASRQTLRATRSNTSAPRYLRERQTDRQTDRQSVCIYIYDASDIARDTLEYMGT
jgi:hypothetical protein